MRLSEALQHPTVSEAHQDADSLRHLEAFQAWLQDAFPFLKEVGELELPDPERLVFHLPGTRHDLPPAVFLAHYDVVPPGDTESWTHPPFSGTQADGYIWGRGAIDDKGSLICMLEALESLMAGGFAPTRTLVFAFGGDEEQSGMRGAHRTAEELASRYGEAWCVVDEGSVVVRDMMSIVRKPLALIGTAEKGYVDLELEAVSHAGHASTPPVPPGTDALARLSRAVLLVQTQGFARTLIPTLRHFMKGLGRHASGPASLLMRVPRLSSPLLLRSFDATPNTSALIRTTVAPTMMHGGETSNVLPDSARANLNIRVLPGTTIDAVLTRVTQLVAPLDVEVRIASSGASDPITQASLSHSMYTHMSESITRHWPTCGVLPFLVTGTTDSRHYQRLSSNIYRFVPFLLGPDDLAGVHGLDEKVSLENVQTAVDVYRHMIEAAGRDDS